MHDDFRALLDRHGIPIHAIPGSFQALVASKDGRRALGVPRNSASGLAGLFLPFRDEPEAFMRACWLACEGTDAIVSSPVAAPVATLIAQRLNVPIAFGQAIPGIRTRQLPHPALPPWPLGGLYNLATYKLAARVVNKGVADVFAAWQREAERLQPIGRPRDLRSVALTAVSPLVVPRPTDWPDNAHVTGYWFLPKDEQPPVPPDLAAFIDDGPPPICFGFGSMMDDEPGELRRIVVDALEALDMRAVIVGGSGGALGGFDGHDRVFEASFVDYDWLFPRTSAVIHQGGAGTASFCLTAGTPQVIVAYCLDHRFWAWRMRQLGIAPPTLRRHTLTVPALVRAIRRATGEPRFRAKARALAPAIRAEQGLDRAMDVLEGLFGRATTAADVPSQPA